MLHRPEWIHGRALLDGPLAHGSHQADLLRLPRPRRERQPRPRARPPPVRLEVERLLAPTSDLAAFEEHIDRMAKRGRHAIFSAVVEAAAMPRPHARRAAPTPSFGSSSSRTASRTASPPSVRLRRRGRWARRSTRSSSDPRARPQPAQEDLCGPPAARSTRSTTWRRASSSRGGGCGLARRTPWTGAPKRRAAAAAVARVGASVGR